MNSIILRNVGVFAHTQLFQNLNLCVNGQDRVGLVAGNGLGKTTLLRCIAGISEPSAGKVTKTRGMQVGYLRQDVPASSLDQTFRAVLQRVLDERGHADGLWRIDVLFEEFEVPSAYHDLEMRALSGGWQRLAMLASLWLTAPDALLLDEPTNHLDVQKIRFLERWIGGASDQIPIVVASHDRSFLDACTNRTPFLRPNASKFYAHPYSKARHLLQNDDAADAAKLSHGSKEAERLRQSAKALRNIGINSRSDSAQKKSKLLFRRADALATTLKPLHQERSGVIRLSSSETHAKVLLSLNDFEVSDPLGRPLFKTGKIRIFQGDRVVLLGANGSGKSQFIAALKRLIEAPETFADAKSHPSIVLGFADQHMSQLPDAQSPFDFIAERFGLGDQKNRSLLAGVGLTIDQQKQKMQTFSLGQKARLEMLALRLTEPNFYLLDEPTNHLDIAGQEKLESELLNQNTTCIIVSHDRFFVNKVSSRRLKIDNRRLEEVAE